MKKCLSLVLAVLVCLCAAAAADSALIPVQISDAGVTCESDAVKMDGKVIRITAPGEYLLSGAMADGQIEVDCGEDGKVILHLNGLKLHNENGAAILIGRVKPRVVIELAEGSENELSDGSRLVFSDKDEPNGVIFSRSDLTVEGKGALKITSGAMDGIVSKDDLRIAGGTITVDAVRHGIRGKDSVEISGGTVSVTAGKDGIRTTNDKDRERGYISVTGGTLKISAGDDPFDFVTELILNGGIVDAVVTPSLSGRLD